MALAIQLAKKGKYHTQPNPMVGCVITDNNYNILATGYHSSYGGDHAEVMAFKKLVNCKNATTVYITLEPCNHHGKTPPCVDLLIDKKIKKVIIAMLDVNPKVSGMAVAKLIANGIEVKQGLMRQEAENINRPFIKAMTKKMPFISCKIAMSIDGKIATATGQSKWITTKHARRDVSKLRMAVDAILTGSGTVITDNPNMTVRKNTVSRPPIRLVIDSNNKVNKNSNINDNKAPTRFFTRENSTLDKSGKIDLRKLLKQLCENGIYHILLESGPTLVGAMLEKKLIDEFIIYTAPIIMGQNSRSAFGINITNLSDAFVLDIKKTIAIGRDFKIIAQPVYR